MSCASDDDCQNGGTCEATPGGQVCLCAPGFLGTLCDEHCPIKCENGGQCEVESDEHGLAMEATYTCKCPSSEDGQVMYRGALCSAPVSTTSTPAPLASPTPTPTRQPAAQNTARPMTSRPTPVSPAANSPPALSSANTGNTKDSNQTLVFALLGSIVIVLALTTMLVVRHSRSGQQQMNDSALVETEDAHVEDGAAVPALLPVAEHDEDLILQVEDRHIT